MDIEVFKTKYNYQAATQVMRQYLDIKIANFECLVLFRMGDFYELFYEDAALAARVLGLALTKRGKTGDEEIPMCGVPHHALENYLNRLLEEGFKVAICNQLETPEEAKKRGGYKAVVKREVTRIITPGTLLEESLLAGDRPNYLTSITVGRYGVAVCYLDLSTSRLRMVSVSSAQLINELVRIKPNEILLSEKFRSQPLSSDIETALNIRISFQVDSFFAEKRCAKIIENYYNIASVLSVGELDSNMISALGSIIEYVSITQKDNLPKLPYPKILGSENFMVIDSWARRNLEITSSLNGGVKGSLFSVINHTLTKGGARLLHEYLSAPLTNIEKINARLAVTEFFFRNISLTHSIRKVIGKTSDLERCITRLQMQRSSPRDLLGIRNTILVAEEISGKFIVNNGINMPENIEKLVAPLLGNTEIATLISESIRDDAPNIISDGQVIKPDYHPKIKELQELIDNGRLYVEKLKERYRQETGIDSLKISNNNVIGLFIDITSRHSSRILDSKFIHRQTTANSIRYTTEELQQLESKLLNGKSMLIALEKEIYANICQRVIDSHAKLTLLSAAINRLDVFTNFAFIAEDHKYCKPVLTNDINFEIGGGRHPVAENFLRSNNQSFTKNDCALNANERIWLITGPNMAGKSTFLRQNAVIAILSHIGSFVPASSAKIGIIDKIFSRVGAGDDLTRGESTFMVEMIETSSILSQSGERSLIILDEVGRGTSTYDGLAIAWAVLEHIHNSNRARCLFATHYHELTALEELLPALANYTVLISEEEGKILFLHKIVPGSADRSYGIHVAQLAGLPLSVVERAQHLLTNFKEDAEKPSTGALKNGSQNSSPFDIQRREMEKYRKVYGELASTDPDKLSPREALEVLYKLKSLA